MPASSRADYPITINAVSGYSGGGKAMIQAHESDQRAGVRTLWAGAGAQACAGNRAVWRADAAADFCAVGGAFLQGMLVSVPLHLDTLPGKPAGADLRAVLEARYAGCDLVRVVPPRPTASWNPRR